MGPIGRLRGADRGLSSEFDTVSDKVCDKGPGIPSCLQVPWVAFGLLSRSWLGKISDNAV